LEDYLNYNSFDPNVMMKKAEELGTQWAEADAAHGLLEDTKKTLLAQITNEFLEQGRNKTTAETMAMASKEYAKHIKQLGQARRDKNLSLVKYNSYKKWLDLIQTKEANLRAEMMIK
jgi:putative sterol carrier protein